jgi:hypothetical protein
MPCEKWSSILCWYRCAVRIYSSAACALSAAETAEFCKAWELSEEARKACERLRTVLLEHEHRHGCQMAWEPAAPAIRDEPRLRWAYRAATDLGVEANLNTKIEGRGETTMKRYLPVFAALAVSLISNTFAPSLKASETDKKTIITISQPVSVEGTTLPAGQYVLRLQDPSTRQDVISIFNGDETRLIARVVANHAYRIQPTGKSEFSFYKSSAGQPAALHTWYYPGDENGLEFLRPRSRVAAQLGAAGN